MEDIIENKLPLYGTSPGRKHGGYALNYLGCTIGHRDIRDACVCVVVPIGMFVGGELGLHEPGLVFGLQAGHVIAFYSKKVTHFNLDFEGVRHSIVLHTDDSLNTEKQAFPSMH